MTSDKFLYTLAKGGGMMWLMAADFVTFQFLITQISFYIYT